MTEIVSRVGVEFTETGAEKVVRSINDLAGAGTKAEGVLDNVADATRRLGEESRRAAAQSKQLQLAGLNLSRQFSDVGVSLAGGINPLMVLIQQGPQIADAFAVARQQGLGFSAVIRGIVSSIAPLLPILGLATVAVGAAAGAFLAWQDQGKKTAEALKATAKSAAEFAKAQDDVRSALGQALTFSEKYKVANDAITKSLDGVLRAQSAAYRETMAGISATDAAGRAAAQRAELERLATVAILRRAAAEAQARGAQSDAAARTARGAARSSGFFATLGSAYLNAEAPGGVDPLARGEAVEIAKFRQLGGEAAAAAAKSEREFAKTLNETADALLKGRLVAPQTAADRKALAAAARDAAKAERERAAALAEMTKRVEGAVRALETPYEKAIRETGEATLTLREGLEAGIISLDVFRESVSRLFLPVVDAKDAVKALNAEFSSTPDDLEKAVKGIDTATDKAIDLARAFSDVSVSLRDMVRSIRSGDVGSLILNLQDLGTGITTMLQGGAQGALTLGSLAANAIGGRTGRAIGGGLGIAASGLGVGAFAASAGGAAALGAAGLGAGAIAGIAAIAPPLAAVAAALYAAVKIFNIGGKPSNNGAGFDLTTGALSGNKRNAETEQAAQGAGEAIRAIQDALKAAGIGLTETVNGLVIGTRDQTQIYLSSGKTLLSAVGDSGAAVDTALRAILESATYVSEAQKKLVDSALAAGKGFDAIQDILARYESAQAITGNLAAQIQQLKDPKAFDLAAVEKNIKAQRDAAKDLADNGFITADVLATINTQLTELRGLEIEQVLKRYAEVIEEATNDNLAKANDNLAAAQQTLIEAYGREADALKETADRFRTLATSLRQYGASLAGGQGGAASFAATRGAFLRTSALAQGGDAAALGDLQRVSDAYLQAARAVAPDARAYARALADVRNAVEASASAADAQVTNAEQQLEALHQMVAALVKLDENIVSVGAAIVALAEATRAQAEAAASDRLQQATAPPQVVAAPTSAPLSVDTSSLERKVEELTVRMAGLQAENNVLLAAINRSNDQTAGVLTRVTRDGISLVTTPAA